MVQLLPVFKGFTVDVKLKQFRRVKKSTIEFSDFDSEQGEKLLCKYIENLNIKNKKEKKILLDLL